MTSHAGRDVTTGNNFWVQNTGSNNQYGYAFTMPEDGLITFLDVFMACSGSTMNAVLCLWDAGGGLLATSATFTCPAGAGGVNGQSWQRQALTTPYHASAGVGYIIGFWRDPAKTCEWSYINSGSTIYPSAPSGGIANVGSPGNLNGTNSTTGQMSAYVEYEKKVYGHSTAGAPVTVLAVYGHSTAGAPVKVLGIYWGGSGGGSPIRLF